MFCANCGNKIEGAGKFCPKCGKPIVAEVQNAGMQPHKKAVGSIWFVAAGGGVVLVLLVCVISIVLIRGMGRSQSGTQVLDKKDNHVMDWQDPVLEEKMHEITGIEGEIKLSDVYYLTELDLSWTTEITDISALSGLTNLEDLSLNYTEITDVSGLSGLTNLEHLGLSDTSVSDYSPVEFVPDLYK